MRMKFLILAVTFYRISSGAIFGEDKRYYNSAPDGAFAAIGRINGCAGTLIDENLVLTAGHCVLDPKTHERFPTTTARSFIFEPGHTGGTSDDPTGVDYVHWLAGKDRGLGTDGDDDQDWAILELHEPVGRKYGWMKIKPFIDDIAYSNDDLAKTYISAGYPIDRDEGNTLSIHDSCRLYQENWMERFNTKGTPLYFFSGALLKAHTMHAIYTDCPAMPGSSGSPIFRLERDVMDGKEKPFIYAMLVASKSRDNHPKFTLTKANTAAATGTYYAKYELIKDNPAERLFPTPIEFSTLGYPKNLPPEIFEALTKDIPAKVNPSANPWNETEHPWLKSLKEEKAAGLSVKRASSGK